MSSEMTVAHLEGWCLIARCGPCQRRQEFPIQLLIQRGLPRHAGIMAAAKGLRCEHCSAPFREVWIIERSPGTAHTVEAPPPIRLVQLEDGSDP
jgi:hypothetical protein